MRNELVRSLFIVVSCSALLAPRVIAAIGTESGAAAGYWDSHSVVIAEVDQFSETKKAYDVIQLHLIGTLSGPFDSGRTTALDARIDVFPTTSAVRERPQKGTLVLAVLLNARPEETDEPGYYIPSSFALYMPAPYAGLCALDGLSDRKINETLSAAQKAHKESGETKTERRRIVTEDAPAFWRTHSLISAEITAVQNRERPQFGSRFELLPKTSFGGDVDPRTTRELTVDVPRGLFGRETKLPGAGATILVLLSRGFERYSVSTERARFMPGDHSPLCVVGSSSDANALTPVPIIETYWETHSLVYAKIKSISETKEAAAPREIILQPKLTLSGTFDPAMHPELSVSAASKLFTSQSPPGNGTMVLVLLAKSGKSYAVSPEPAEFMPGDGHQPICPVWDLSDHRVSDTLKAIRDLRARESASKEAKP